MPIVNFPRVLTPDEVRRLVTHVNEQCSCPGWVFVGHGTERPPTGSKNMTHFYFDFRSPEGSVLRLYLALEEAYAILEKP